MSVSGLDALKALPDDLLDSARAAMLDAARELVRLQTDAIEAGRTPSGRSQQQNAPRTAKRKAGKPPLVNTGRLSDPLAWRVYERDGDVQILPPSDRMDAVRELEDMGYTLIFSDVPDQATDIIEQELASELAAKGLL